MPVSWPSKDPSAVLDFIYRIPLDANDSIANISAVTFTQLAGTCVIASKSLAAAPDTTSDGYGQDLTVWLSGGADGETDVFQVSWTTTLTRQNDDILTLPVANADLPALDLVNYTAPLPGHLTARYPAFAGVPFTTIQMWLTDAERFVTTGWRSKDYPVAIMALAAHNMAIQGLGTDNSDAQIPGGVTSFKMGPMQINLTPQAANAKLAGDVTSTRYGAEYAFLRDMNFGGPELAPSGLPLDGIWPEIFVPS